MQHIYAKENNHWVTLTLPPAEEPIHNGASVTWGDAGTIFTPAFWRARYWMDIDLGGLTKKTYKLGHSLQEETVACLLGGYGITAESSMAYLERFKELDIFSKEKISQDDIWEILQTPLLISGSKQRYRFWKNKGIYIHAVLTTHKNRLKKLEYFKGDPKEFREELMQMKGIGIKTASWITRNWLDTNSIAVIDIHIHRALQLLGMNAPLPNSDSKYLQSETYFIDLANAINTSVNFFDILVWDYMRKFNGLALKRLNQKGLALPQIV